MIFLSSAMFVASVVNEGVNQGIDTVQSTVTFSLSANVENLTLAGGLSVEGIGNSLDNVIRGNSGNNRIDGKAGADTLIGGAGDDTYVITGTDGDIVVEQQAEGNDTIITDLSYTLPDNVENLEVTGNYSFKITSTGNSLNNVIKGRASYSNDVRSMADRLICRLRRCTPRRTPRGIY